MRNLHGENKIRINIAHDPLAQIVVSQVSFVELISTRGKRVIDRNTGNLPREVLILKFRFDLLHLVSTYATKGEVKQHHIKSDTFLNKMGNGEGHLQIYFHHPDDLGGGGGGGGGGISRPALYSIQLRRWKSIY